MALIMTGSAGICRTYTNSQNKKRSNVERQKSNDESNISILKPKISILK